MRRRHHGVRILRARLQIRSGGRRDPCRPGHRSGHRPPHRVVRPAEIADRMTATGRLGRYESAATIAGFAFSSLTAMWVAEINPAIAHLRDVLGDQTYEALARKGE